MSQRYKIILEYCGTGLSGWQEQGNLKTVQGLLQEAIFQFTGEQVKVFGAGRTDAGVHSLGQVAHFDLEKSRSQIEILSALNHFVKKDGIAILNCQEVDNIFHARFSAKKRSYLYKIVNRKAPLTIERYLAWQVIEKLDLEAMKEGAKLLIGQNDFESFRSSHCQSQTSIKNLDIVTINSVEDKIELFFSAQSFLHNQVRIMVGTLRKIGNGTWLPEQIEKIFAAKKRAAAGTTAPPYGLYFVGPNY